MAIKSIRYPTPILFVLLVNSQLSATDVIIQRNGPPGKTFVYQNTVNGDTSSFVLGVDGRFGLAHYRLKDGKLQDEILNYRGPLYGPDLREGRSGIIGGWLYEAIGENGNRSRWFLFATDGSKKGKSEAYTIYTASRDADVRQVGSFVQWLPDNSSRHPATPEKEIEWLLASRGFDRATFADLLFPANNEDAFVRNLIWNALREDLATIIKLPLRPLYFASADGDNPASTFLIVGSADERERLQELLEFPTKKLPYSPDFEQSSSTDRVREVRSLARPRLRPHLKQDNGTLDLGNAEARLTRALADRATPLAKAIREFAGGGTTFELEPPSQTENDLTILSKWTILANQGTEARMFWRTKVELEHRRGFWNVISTIELGQNLQTHRTMRIHNVGACFGILEPDNPVQVSIALDDGGSEPEMTGIVEIAVIRSEERLDVPKLPTALEPDNRQRALIDINRLLIETVRDALIVRS
ncbi:MAG: hypothetical protein EXS05_01545 [Planctomycetaceae bacterium]|nr:hypothetical protein [Planctomycetaceae bacterium]